MSAATPPGGAVSSLYEARVRLGEIEGDRQQRAIARRLDDLVLRLERARLSSKGSALGWLFGRGKPQAVQGLYIHGDVGRGKTMLMDMFHAALPGTAKRRAHFNDFMADCHTRLHAIRAADENSKLGDPMPVLARQIAEESRTLAFDEFTVSDVADAMVLARLFGELFERGVTLVATSNVAPNDLYRDGLNRARFEPFIAKLCERCEVVSLDAAGRDYRRDVTEGAKPASKATIRFGSKPGSSKPVGGKPVGPKPAASKRAASKRAASNPTETADRAAAPVYVVGSDFNASRPLERAWQTFASGPGVPENVARGSRRIDAPRAVSTTPPGGEGSAAWFTFDALCRQPLGAADYAALCERYRTLVVSGVPVFTSAMRNEAKRFIALVDTAYEAGTRLVVGADAEPDALKGTLTRTEAFEFSRTASRLHEMRTERWRLREAA